MSDEAKKRPAGPFGKLLWLLVIVAIVVIWWWFRGSSEDTEARRTMIQADYVAAVTDPDDILIDLKDDATPDAIEAAFGIDLVLVDDSGVAEQTKLYRAHVDPAKRDALIAAIALRSDVEIVEPDAEMMIPAGEVLEVPAPE